MKHRTKMLRLWPVTVLGVVLAAEAAWLRNEYQRAALWVLRERQQLSHAAQIATQVPAPTPENEQTMAADVGRLRHLIAVRHAELWPQATTGVEGDSAREPVDAYFDLATMRTRLRASAEAANVALKPDECFGFDAYAREGPSEASRDLVRQQSIAAEAILACLFEAQPERLVSVKRERVEPAPAAGDRQLQDMFAISPSLSLRRPGAIDAWAFRLEFRGTTAVLRKFLDALARAPEMLAARSIEVVPPDGARLGNAAQRGEAAGPFVRPRESHFAVIVEVVKPSSAFLPVAP